MKCKFIITIASIILLCVNTCWSAINLNKEAFLSKPTGQYGIGFEDFHWINSSVCSDPNYNNNPEDFSPDNKKFCHEIMARIYYPTSSEIIPGEFYYSPLVKSEQAQLSKAIVVPKKQIEQLNQIKSFSINKQPIILGKIFPVILFSPGLGCPAEMYENFITELVSHGYIVIGINTPFISGDIELPSRHIVKYNKKYDDEKFDAELMKIITADFSYIYEQIHKLHDSSIIFQAMDLNNIGAFGHSVGGNVVANAVHAHTNWFRAAAALDIGYDLSGESLEPFSIPFMHTISSSIKARSSVPIFKMGQNGFVIGVSPTEQNRDFSYHMNFSDMSTLQYLPAYQTLMWWLVNILHQELPVGKGNGWEITNSINTYSVQFFNTFIKSDVNPGFSNCNSLSNNTFIKCGPGNY